MKSETVIPRPTVVDDKHRPTRPGCRLCGKPKPPGRGRSYCSDRCSKRASQLSIHRYADARIARVNAIKLERGCDKCGYMKCAAALDFHHRDPSTKEFHVTGTSATWARTEAEIAKCDLLCANCHRELHFEEGSRRMSRDPSVYYDDGFDPRKPEKRWNRTEA